MASFPAKNIKSNEHIKNGLPVEYINEMFLNINDNIEPILANAGLSFIAKKARVYPASMLRWFFECEMKGIITWIYGVESLEVIMPLRLTMQPLLELSYNDETKTFMTTMTYDILSKEIVINSPETLKTNIEKEFGIGKKEDEYYKYIESRIGSQTPIIIMNNDLNNDESDNKIDMSKYLDMINSIAATYKVKNKNGLMDLAKSIVKENPIINEEGLAFELIKNISSL